MVGVVAHSDWPAAARVLPRVGDAAALDLERIVALAPDLIVAWPYTAPPQLAALRAQSIPVFVSDPRSIAGIEARGFILGAPLAVGLGVGFVPVRKEGKLPGDVHAESYDLEYGQDTVDQRLI